VRGGRLQRFTVTPEEFGVARAPLEALSGGTPEENAQMIRSLLQGGAGPRLDIVIANAAAALVVTGVAEDFREGAAIARRAITSGEAQEKLERLKRFSHFHGRKR